MCRAERSRSSRVAEDLDPTPMAPAATVGFVLIAAPTVNNAGTITATDGQVILAAGIGVSLVPPVNTVTQFLNPELTGQVGRQRR